MTGPDANSITIYRRSGPCGSGKTTAQIDFMVAIPGRYIVALEKRSLISEMEAIIAAKAAASGRKIKVASVTSMQSDGSPLSKAHRGNSSNCRADISALPDIYGSGHTPHVIILVTHRSLLAVASDDFAAWDLVIDEVPSIFTSETISTETSWEWLARHFALEPMKQSRWSSIRLISDLTRSELARDTLMAPLLVLYDRIVGETTTVAVNAVHWADTARKEVVWTWYSVWSVEQFRGFRSVTMMGTELDKSLFARLANAHANIEWIDLPPPNTRQFSPRKMVVRYFAAGHEASSTLFETDEGIAYLMQIDEYLSKSVHAQSHIWSTNARRAGLFANTPGTRLDPRQAGSNLYATMTEVSMIYTAKPSPTEVSIFAILGVDRGTVIEDRELGPIVQMVARTSVRDADSTATITVHVYDETQAYHVGQYFGALNYVDVVYEPIDLGFLRVERMMAKTGRPRKEFTPEEAAERAKAVKESARIAMAKRRAEARGDAPARPRGRPAKYAELVMA